MPTILLQTIINADIETCFDLSRSIDLHKISTKKTKESAIAGKTEGLISMGETVTWQAIHLGINQKLTSKITAYHRPFHFCDEQVKGIFSTMKHDHYFEEKDGQTIMKDVFYYRAPLWILGRVAEQLFLTTYLRNFLLKRNEIIKQFAEEGTSLPGLSEL